MLILQILLFAFPPFYFATLNSKLRAIGFYSYLSIVLVLGGFLGSAYSFPISDTVFISGGNLAYGAFMMTAIMLVIMEDTLDVLRDIIRLVFVVNIFVYLLFTFFTSVLGSPAVVNPLNVPADLFSVALPFVVLGQVLIITELLFFLFVFQRLKPFLGSVWMSTIAYIGMYILMLMLDGVLFPLIALFNNPELVSIIAGNVTGKFTLGLLYSLPVLLFVSLYRERFAAFLARPIELKQVLQTSSRAQLEKALINSEARYRTLVEKFNEAILIMQDGQVIFANRIALNRLGLNLDANKKHYVPDEASDGNPNWQIIQQVLAENEGKSFVREDITLYDGQDAISYELTCIPFEYDGRLAQQIMLHDITAIKQSQARLMESEARFRRLANYTPTLIWMTDAENRNTYMNQPFLDYVKAKDSAQLHWMDYIHEDDRSEVAFEYRSVLQAQLPFAMEYRMMRHDGSYRWVLNNAIPRFTDDNVFEGYTGSCIDITDVKEAQIFLRDIASELDTRVSERTKALKTLNDALRAEIEHRQQSEMFLQNILDGQLAAIAVMDTGGIVLTTNNAWNMLVEYSNEVEIVVPVGSNYVAMWQELGKDDAEAKAVLAGINSMQTHEQNRFEAEYEVLHASTTGSTWYLIQISAFEYADFQRFLVTQTDITSQKLAVRGIQIALDKEVELRQWQADFMSMVAHDFGTPIASITLGIDKMNTYLERYTPDQLRQQIDRIQNSISHLKNLYHEFQFVNKAATGHTGANHQLIDIASLAQVAAYEAEVAYGSVDRIRLTVSLSQRNYMTDDYLLRKILSNLLSNALKYGKNELVYLSIEDEDKHLCIAVKDSGIGIPLKDQATLFTTFRRASNVGAIKGTGLGLHVIREAVTVLGGFIDFDSIEGTGTTFNVRIPISDEPYFKET